MVGLNSPGINSIEGEYTGKTAENVDKKIPHRVMRDLVLET